MFDGHLAQYSSQGVRILDKPINEYLNDPGSLFFSERVSGVLRLAINFYDLQFFMT